MAKIWIIGKAGKSRVPFLRGILTRSLMEAGLTFDEAYEASSELRQELEQRTSEIGRDQLRERAAAYLEERFGRTVRETYESLGRTQLPVQVRGLDGKLSPFSRIQHLRCLEACGLTDDQASVMSSRILGCLLDRKIAEVTSCELGRLTYDLLREQYGKSMAHRYLVWVDHSRSGKPIVVFIGGATGTGKSTVATELAHRLGIVRIQSTDMLREVMRMMIPERLLPVLHTSSFNAGSSLPGAGAGNLDDEAQLADGYLTQSELLSGPCEAVVRRALRERVSVILEGVHLHPSLLPHMGGTEDATVVMIMLALLDPEQLRSRLAGRVLEAPGRELSSHLSQFDRIWRLQSFLLSEADRTGIPILVNNNKEQVTNTILGTIIHILAQRLEKTPDQVFQSQKLAAS
jgi:2-phosphoglycerate kinase